MSQDEIKVLIEKVFDERIQSAITRMTNRQNDFSDRKDMLIPENVNEDDPRVQSLQTEIDNLYIGIEVLRSLSRG